MRKVGETRILIALLFGVLGGLVLGVLARLWMRTISTEPEFSWGGTLFIVGIFLIFGTSQACVYVLRSKMTRKTSTEIVRGIGGFFSLAIFVGAGAQMLPTVALGSIALWRMEFNNKIRLLLAAIGLIIPATITIRIISDFGWEIASAGRLLLMLLVYGAVIIATHPTVTAFHDPHSISKPMSRTRKIVLAALIILITGLFFISTVGVPGS